MRQNYFFCMLMLLSAEIANADEQRAVSLFTVVGVIRIGEDDSGSLVVMKDKSRGKTHILHCDAPIPNSDYTLVKVNRQSVTVRGTDGQLETLELQEADPQKTVENGMWPHLEESSAEDLDQEAEVKDSKADQPGATAKPQELKLLPMPTAALDTASSSPRTPKSGD